MPFITIVHKIRPTNWLLLGIFIISITSCTTPLVTEPKSSSQQVSSNQTDTVDSLTKAIEAAKRLSSPEKEDALVQLAQRLFSLGEVYAAQQLIQFIDTQTMSPGSFIEYSMTSGTIYLSTQSLFKAKNTLNNSRLTLLQDQFSIDQQRRFHQLKAELYQRIGQVNLSLNERIALGSLLSDNQENINNNSEIWRQLNGLTLEELNEYSQTANGTVLQQWFALAIISKTYQGSLELQSSAINNWVQLHPNHPASQQLPEDIAILQTMISNRPQHIALMLPLQGKLAKAGQAIRDGFFASYYLSKGNQYPTPEISLYDTSSGDITRIYNQAINNGANMVIGPLSKSNVEKLRELPSIPVPTLALNYFDNGTTNLVNNGDGIASNDTPALYQFGLSLEDEAIQVANRAWLEGHRQALIMSSGASWSQRASDTFTQQWQALGGIIIQHNQLKESESYSDTIKNLLHIDQSQQRASELKRLFGRSFEFEPRRRHDIDMIFLAARSQEGRQIKPTLNFYYASDIPVYSMSQIYTRTNGQNKNIDLNGIRFTTLPWVLNTLIEEKTMITENINVTQGYDRLYALGTDSFLLYPRLQQLEQLEGQTLNGTTGKLSMTADKRINREQLWAEIRNGDLRPLRTLTLSDDIGL